MKDQFVPYEQALKLKELGFDEECFTYFSKGILQDTPRENGDDVKYPGDIKFDRHQNSNLYPDDDCSAPLWQQAFDWFSDHKKMSSHIIEHGDGRIYWRIIIKGDKTGTVKGHSAMKESREEARVECLKKLIELCKNA